MVQLGGIQPLSTEATLLQSADIRRYRVELGKIHNLDNLYIKILPDFEKVFSDDEYIISTVRQVVKTLFYFNCARTADYSIAPSTF